MVKVVTEFNIVNGQVEGLVKLIIQVVKSVQKKTIKMGKETESLKPMMKMGN